MTLSPPQFNPDNPRLARLRLLFGDAGLNKLAHSTVMVVGLGGVGGACAEAIARGGVGTLLLIDADVVEESNLNRQAVAWVSTVGKPKTKVMAEMVRDINPDISVHTRAEFLTKDNANSVLDSFPTPDYVLDCIDTISAKLAIAQWCAERGIYLISAMGAANKLDPTQLRFAPLHKTKNCPVAKAVREGAKKRGIRGVEVLYSPEDPVAVVAVGAGDAAASGPGHEGAEQDGSQDPLHAAPQNNKAQKLGSTSFMPPILGEMIAGRALLRLVGRLEYPNPPRLSARAHEELAARHPEAGADAGGADQHGVTDVA
ncbi:MAG: tRNA threonylcarbamoyladenosine dehydratase [Corynebacterium sp.]|nr:tRNA threonylcarbamoyladenosine dehydratase [Corynebacterium sp.]